MGRTSNLASAKHDLHYTAERVTNMFAILGRCRGEVTSVMRSATDPGRSDLVQVLLALPNLVQVSVSYSCLLGI
jgi:hypothetical protein